MFITDSLLTTLMCTPRSVYSWDILVTRAAGRLFFDKRDGSSLDMLTVAETSPEAIPEDKDNINGMQQLSLEATAINQNFSQQVICRFHGQPLWSQPLFFICASTCPPSSGWEE